jgi:hypothetical protein
MNRAMSPAEALNDPAGAAGTYSNACSVNLPSSNL